MFVRIPLGLGTSLPELLTLLVTRQLDDVPGLHRASTVQRVVHAEFRMLQQLVYELATLTPMAWVDILRQRFTLRQRRQGDPINQLQTAPHAEQTTLEMSQSVSPPLQPSWHGCLVCLKAYLVAPRLSPGSELPVCGLSSLAASHMFSTLLLPPSHPSLLSFCFFVLPVLHNSRLHIKLGTSLL